MTASARHHRHSLDAYFAVERMSPARHEFAEGQIYVMAGGTPRHDWLESRMVQTLGARLGDGPCFVMTSNRRIATADDLYTYADASVFCGEMTIGADQTATNPVVLVEVLSDSTRDYDRGEKLARYQTIPSLRHVLLVEQQRVDMELWSRTVDGWTRQVVTELDGVVDLPAIGVRLSPRELYAGAERFAG